jgi:hypothetical protein
MPLLHVEAVDGTIILIDDCGTVHEVCELTSYREAKRQINIWLSSYAFDVADAYMALCDEFTPSQAGF